MWQWKEVCVVDWRMSQDREEIPIALALENTMVPVAAYCPSPSPPQYHGFAYGSCSDSSCGDLQVAPKTELSRHQRCPLTPFRTPPGTPISSFEESRKNRPRCEGRAEKAI